MRGSTLHRSSLTKENMNVLSTFIQTVKKQAAPSQVNQYHRVAKNQELDLLYDGAQKVHNLTKGSRQKSPVVYLIIGFLVGVAFMTIITFIVSISAMTPKSATEQIKPEEKAAIEEAIQAPAPVENVTTNEKYIVKSGDTINGIAYRYYGKYNEAKIQEILRVNNISNPASLSIGQELIIPVDVER